MNRDRLIRASERWVGLLLRLYPKGFRDEMGAEVLEAYRDKSRAALAERGRVALLAVWISAWTDFLRNGFGERLHPSSDTRTGAATESRSVQLRRHNRGVLAGALIASVALHAALFIGFPAVDAIPEAGSPIELRSPVTFARQGPIVRVTFEAPQVVYPDGTVTHPAPPPGALEPRNLSLTRHRSVAICDRPELAGDPPVSGSVHFFLYPSGRRHATEVMESSGDRCADAVILASVVGSRYAWLVDDLFREPLEVIQPVALAQIRN